MTIDQLDFGVLSPEQRAVIFLIYVARLTEREAAEEFTELYDCPCSRDQIHTIKSAALRRLRRSAQQLEAVA